MGTASKDSPGTEKTKAGCGCAAPAEVGCCPPPEAADVERLARIAKALGDPIRLGMLDVMAQGRACCGLPEPSERGVPGAGDPTGICVCDFQDHFGLGQSKASYHLRVLREAGLVREESRGKWSFYTIDAQAAASAFDSLRDMLRVSGGPREGRCEEGSGGE
jgi:ArsR family transcriptional regulator, arsenate/arsenite/antimonite-responsive transcriptional repressor